MDLNLLEITNPWWKKVEAIDQDPHLNAVIGKPYYFDNPVKKMLILDKGHTYILRGARQVGKTTLLKEMISHSIRDENFPPQNCLFLSCEAFENFQELQDILTTWIKDKKEEPTRIFLDEITFVDQWQRALLWLINAGLLHNSLTFITGSNARDLKKMGERFPGRNVKQLDLYPLSIIDCQSLDCFRSKKNDELLEIYLSIGGFPHAIRDYQNFGAVSDDTYETYANWIFGDAHRFNLARELLTHMLFRIYDTLASQVNYQKLTEDSPVKSHETAAAYVEHLELAFLCKVLNCYDQNKDMEAPRKSRKIYFIDPLLYQIAGGFLRGIRNTHQWWSEKLKDKQFKGNVFESVVVNHFARKSERIYYWYSSNLKKEADILIRKGDETYIYEVKSRHEKIGNVLNREVGVITPDNFFEML